MATTVLERAKKLYGQKGPWAVAARVAEEVGWTFYTPFSTLHQLGIRYGTDKWNEYHTYKGVSYLDVYEKYFAPIRRERLNVLEIGVLHGNSLRTWKAFFPKAQLFGLDIDPRCKEFEEDRISITIGSQTDARILTALAEKAGHFDIVIDDGSHVNHHILTSFKYLFPRVTPGGFYAMEDLGGTYRPARGRRHQGTVARDEVQRPQ